MIFFLVESPFRHLFQKQITDLILVCQSDIKSRRMKPLYEYILGFFKRIKHLSITGLFSRLSLHDLPTTTCSSSTLSKLCIRVNDFVDCIPLLDGRLEQLTTLIVNMGDINEDLPIAYNMVKMRDQIS